MAAEMMDSSLIIRTIVLTKAAKSTTISAQLKVKILEDLSFIKKGTQERRFIISDIVFRSLLATINSLMSTTGRNL